MKEVTTEVLRDCLTQSLFSFVSEYLITNVVDETKSIIFLETIEKELVHQCNNKIFTAFNTNVVVANSMRFVFIGKEDMTKAQEMVIFVALSMIGLVMNQMIMWFAVEHLGMFYAVAKIFSTMLVTTYNFISRKRFLEA